MQAPMPASQNAWLSGAERQDNTFTHRRQCGGGRLTGRRFDAAVAASYRDFASSKIIAAPFSAIIMVGELVLPEVIDGITEASATRTPSMPTTRRRASTTPCGS